MKTRFLSFTILFFTLNWQFSQAQWTSVGSGITATPRVLSNFYPVNENVIWGSAWNPNGGAPTFEFTRTTDGGQTWLPGTLNGVATSFYDFNFYALDDQTAWIATADELNPISGRIYKTTDGGANWAHQSTGFTGFNETPAGIWFWNENEGFSFGATCNASYNNQISVYTTADGGSNWSKVVAPDMPAQLPGEAICIANFGGFFSVAGDHAWFGTSKGRIFRSSDRGHTWQVSSTPFSTFIPSVGFRDSLHGIALRFDPIGIARSSDGGETWTTVPVSVPTAFRGWEVQYVPSTRSTWFIVSSTSNHMVSYDDGNTWEAYSSNIDVWSAKFLDAKTGFAGSFTTNPTKASLFKWSGPALGNRLFVNDNATGANTGYNWTDAFNDLQDALAIAEAGDQIWVAEGTYKPAAPGGVQNATFLIDKNLRLYGGFVGTETSLSQRGDPAQHPTVLSGDLNGDDVTGNFNLNRTDNNAHVISIAESGNGTVIDGFTVSGGNGTPSSPPASNDLSPERGGGVTSLASCSINNCIFRDNSAVWGGAGCYARFGDVALFENCAFEGNSAPRGALALGFHNDAKIINCQFNGNMGSFGGAGAYLGNSNFEVRDCQFTNNLTPGGEGGAIFLWQNPQIEFENPSMSFENCSFTGNQAHYGGGISFNNFIPGGHLMVKECSFDNNSTTSDGGGLSVYNENTAPELLNVTLTDSYFANNTSNGNGGGAYFFNLGETSVEACTFSGNTASSDGGGIYANSSASVLLENCLFDGNASSNAAIFAELLTNYNLLNCTVADNQVNGIQLADQSALTLQNTILHNPGFIEYTALTEDATFTSHGGNLIADASLAGLLVPGDKQGLDPLFMGGGDYHLTEGSPCVDAGNPDGMTATEDLGGDARVQGGRVDMGAFESPFVSSTKEILAGEVAVSPNPTSSFLNIQLPETGIGLLDVQVFDAQGRLVLLGNGPRLDVQGLAAGMYSLRVVVGERVFVGKFIKQ